MCTYKYPLYQPQERREKERALEVVEISFQAANREQDFGVEHVPWSPEPVMCNYLMRRKLWQRPTYGVALARL